MTRLKPPQPKRLAETMAHVIGHLPRASIIPAKFYILEKAAWMFLSINREPDPS